MIREKKASRGRSRTGTVHMNSGDIAETIIDMKRLGRMGICVSCIHLWSVPARQDVRLHSCLAYAIKLFHLWASLFRYIHPPTYCVVRTHVCGRLVCLDGWWDLHVGAFPACRQRVPIVEPSKVVYARQQASLYYPQAAEAV